MVHLRPPWRARVHLLYLAAALLLTGCSSSQNAADTRAPIAVETAVSQTRITGTLADDPQVQAQIAPYREALQAKMSERLAVCPRPMETGRPEGMLGALIADIVLERARQESEIAVDACVINNGGLRIPWPQGVITLSLVYEVMPFDNEIVLLRLGSVQMGALAGELAARRGEPISGFGFGISEGEAVDLRVGGQPLEARDYWVATSDYLAGGGGGMPTLWEPQEIRGTGVLIRDAIADALRRYGETESGELGEIPRPELGRIYQQ